MRWIIVWSLESLCTALDQIPGTERGTTGELLPSCYGCRLGISRLSLRLEERWNTGVWTVVK